MRHHSHVHFPPLLAGVINRNPRDDEGREQEQRNGALSPTLRAGGNVALIAWIWVGHSVLMVVSVLLCVPNSILELAWGLRFRAPHLLKLVKQFGPASRRPHAYLSTPTPSLAIEQALREDARIPRP